MRNGTYIWGVDGSAGTYITNYVVFGLGLLYSACLFHVYKSSRWIHTDGLHRNVDVNNADVQDRAIGKVSEKARKFILVMIANFFFCAAFNAVGAPLHQFVPLIEPVPLPQTSIQSDKIKSRQLMLLKLFPWILLWQLANVLAMLYGIGIFLTALYSFEYHVGSKELTSRKGRSKGPESMLHFNLFKRISFAMASWTVIMHGISRIYRISQFSNFIFRTPSDTDRLLEVDFYSAKFDVDLFGWMWSVKSAIVVMFSASFVNGLITFYMFISSLTASKLLGGADFGGVKLSFVRTVGAWIVLLGGSVQVFWAGSCGTNLPIDCPFPLWFNHNALYHSLQGLGMTFWFLAEWTYFRAKSSVSKVD